MEVGLRMKNENSVLGMLSTKCLFSIPLETSSRQLHMGLQIREGSKAGDRPLGMDDLSEREHR